MKNSPSAGYRAQLAPLSFILTNDSSGLTRGRGFPTSEIESYKADGCGWVQANQALTPFDVIGAGHPFGPLGDIRLRPDLNTEVRVDLNDDRPPLHFLLADTCNFDGTPWDCCPRGFLRDAIRDLQQEFGLSVHAAFEHEFTLLGDMPSAPSFSYAAYTQHDRFCGTLLEALNQAGVEPEMMLPEYGPGQFEVTLRPGAALEMADRAVVLRELTREVARRHGMTASFAPKVTPDGVASGVHLHFGLRDAVGEPLNFDAHGPGQMSAPLTHFCAGVLVHMPALVAFTAPSVISYLRLRPHHWSAAFTSIGLQNREAALRICPAVKPEYAARAHHVEFRAADACASPYFVMGMLIRAGLDGLRNHTVLPDLITGDPAVMNEAECLRCGVKPLPASLADALAEVERDTVVRDWLSPTFWQCYQAMKNEEIALIQNLDAAAACRRYAGVY